MSTEIPLLSGRDHPVRTAVATGAVFVVAAVLVVLGGVTGLAFALGTAVLFALAPPVFPFVLGQTGLVVVASPGLPPIAWAGQAALLVVLLADERLQWSVPTLSLSAAAVGAVSLGTWFAARQSRYLAAAVVVAGSAVAFYAVHRYEVVRTGEAETT